MFAGRLDSAERGAAQQRSAAEEARGAAAKLEADLEGLSGAYNSLETHSFALEARLRQLEYSDVPKGAAGDSAAEAPTAADNEEEDDGLNDLLICLGQASTVCLQVAVFLPYSEQCRDTTCSTYLQVIVSIGLSALSSEFWKAACCKSIMTSLLRLHPAACKYDAESTECFCRRSRRWSG